MALARTGGTRGEIVKRSLNDVAGNRLIFVLAASLLWMAPFETITPIFSFPGQNLSNLEILAAVAILTWVVQGIAGKRITCWKTILTIPMLLLVLIMVLSSLLAPAHTTPALSFTGRFASGVLVFHLVAGLVNSRKRLLIFLGGIVIAGNLVSTLGLLEYLQVRPVLNLLGAFQAAPSYAGNQIRVSSTLQYPTITSMYLEIVFALGMGLLLFSLHTRKLWWTVGLCFSQWLAAACIFLTLTRSGLISLGIAILLAWVMAFLWWGLDARTGTVSALALTLALTLAASTFLSQESWLRLVTLDQRQWYQVHYQVPSEFEMRTGGGEQASHSTRKPRTGELASRW